MVRLCLKQADCRAAEAMNSMDMNAMRNGESMSIDSSQHHISHDDMQLEMQELSKYLLAKSYFDCKEYDRAASVLKDCQSLKATFLKLYSTFLVVQFHIRP